jgi:P pilus assembly chaperone PapD
MYRVSYLLISFPENLKDTDTQITGTLSPSATITLTYKVINPTNYPITFTITGNAYYESEYCNNIFEFVTLRPNSETSVNIPLKFTCARGEWDVQATVMASMRLFGFIPLERKQEIQLEYNNNS